MTANSSENGPALEARGVSHWYKAHRALDQVTFEVATGSIHGFVGPNGAGKTTTLKIAATLLRPRSGTMRVFGRDVVYEYRHVRPHIGFMPDYPALYSQMTVFELLDFFGAAYGLSLYVRDRVIKDVLALTDMEGRRDDLIRTLSRGMQQRVSLARVLVHDPDLLLLDEPAAGLDPRGRIELMEVLKELKSMGKTIFISSHILAELANLCDSVTILDRGQVRFSGAMDELLEQRDAAGARHVVQLAQPHEPAEAAVRQLPGLLRLDIDESRIRYLVEVRAGEADPNQILAAIMKAGGQVVAFSAQRKGLDQAFLDLTEPGVPE